MSMRNKSKEINENPWQKEAVIPIYLYLRHHSLINVLSSIPCINLKMISIVLLPICISNSTSMMPRNSVRNEFVDWMLLKNLMDLEPGEY